MVRDGNQIYFGNHFVIYKKHLLTMSWPVTYTVLQVNYTSTNKQTHKEKEIRFVITRGGSQVRGNWMQGV